ncbi:MAG: hypothetical protein DRJ51_01335 [Thermoprotei archaeon]|nr:MAG: hypothetical protein DRJ51_01335 [Thermoprotei archaeon]RLE82817.1 MAG: hypothetical protein DRJ36_00210 [Thermoprotei archaeon]RLF02520.1 MAG: hypothetical protein DRJ59_03380 [Thermoprotei archaeon]
MSGFEDPLQAIVELKKQIDEMFNNILASFPRTFEVAGFYEPPYDLEEAENEFIIRVDLPGFSRDEIKVKVSEDSVEIKAEKSEEWKSEERNRKYVVKQRIYESYHRVIKLPEKIDTDPSKIKAILDNGVLELRLPKAGYRREVELTIE